MTAQQIKEWRSDVAMYDSPFAAMYYPWVKIENPVGVGADTEILVPPSGHIAGLWARTDATRGVWKAPANDTLRGVLDLERTISQNEQSLLNPIGINCIRPFGVRGIRVWGARTLTSDTDWTYINVRRLFNMAEKTIQDGTQFAVFEPNDVALWEGVKRTLDAFLRGLWTQALSSAPRPTGVLRQVRRGDEPAGERGRGPPHRRGRAGAGQARRVRHLPHRAAQAVRRLNPLNLNPRSCRNG